LRVVCTLFPVTTLMETRDCFPVFGSFRLDAFAIRRSSGRSRAFSDEPRGWPSTSVAIRPPTRSSNAESSAGEEPQALLPFLAAAGASPPGMQPFRAKGRYRRWIVRVLFVHLPTVRFPARISCRAGSASMAFGVECAHRQIVSTDRRSMSRLPSGSGAGVRQGTRMTTLCSRPRDRPWRSG